MFDHILSQYSQLLPLSVDQVYVLPPPSISLSVLKSKSKNPPTTPNTSTRKWTEKLGSLLCVGQLHLIWGLPQSVVEISRHIPLEKTDFLRRYQLRIASLLGTGLCAVSLLSAGLLSCLNLYCHSLCEFVCVSVLLCLEDTISFEVFPLLSECYMPALSFLLIGGTVNLEEIAVQHTGREVLVKEKSRLPAISMNGKGWN